MRLGVAFGWHVHPFETLLELVRTAEQLGYDAAHVDGDVSVIPSLGERELLDGWTVTIELLARTQRIAIGSLRLIHHWNPARLAQAVATAERLHPGRLRLALAIGASPHDARFGLPWAPAGERIRWLKECVPVLRRLWAGETVSFAGRFVRLEGARVRPHPPPGRPEIAIAARRPRMLRAVVEHADVWEMNLPPVARWLEPAIARVEALCRERGRDPGSLVRSMWVFVRFGSDRARQRAEFLRLNPWFADLSGAELDEAIVAGDPEACRRRLEGIAERFGLGRVVIDLSGLEAGAACEVLAGLAPETRVDSDT